ncbi:MAG: hypothetical protein JRN17_05515 [Nitrososphaerota archaeon]|nr:hypothetical protein [Nitrososphaerota archaeon]MDG6990551.1 hypothetical protein [Nitrososphaerota archaeon]MDG7012529.1 hypothetical protein [Nitrososphaerota archaeon]
MAQSHQSTHDRPAERRTDEKSHGAASRHLLRCDRCSDLFLQEEVHDHNCLTFTEIGMVVPPAESDEHVAGMSTLNA